MAPDFPPRMKALLAEWATADAAQYQDGTSMKKDARQALEWVEANTPKLVECRELAEVDRRTPPDTLVNGGALQMVVNIMRRLGKDEYIDELLATAIRNPGLYVNRT